MLAGNSSISLAGSEEQIIFFQQSPKMLKIVSENFIHALLLVLGLFLKISRWVPPRRRDNWRVNGRCNSPIRRNNRDLVRHGEQRTKRIFEDGAAMTGQEKKNAKLTTGERLTKRELNRPKPAYLYKLCETEHPGDYESAGIFILESRRDLGRLYEMAPVRIRIFNHKSDLFFSARKQSAFFAVADPGGGGLVWDVWTPPPPQSDVTHVLDITF